MLLIICVYVLLIFFLLNVLLIICFYVLLIICFFVVCVTDNLFLCVIDKNWPYFIWFQMLPLFMKRCATLYEWNIDQMCEEGAESMNKLLQTLWRGLCNFKNNCNYQISLKLDAKVIGGHLFDMHNFNDDEKKSIFIKLIEDTINELNEQKINPNIKHFFNFLLHYKKTDIIPNIYFNEDNIFYDSGFFFNFFFLVVFNSILFV